MTEGKTLKELGVKAGDVVESCTSGNQFEISYISQHGLILLKCGGMLTDKRNLYRLISRAHPARVDRYDLDHIEYNHRGNVALNSFVFSQTPEGHEWWWDNQHTPEGIARLEQMRAQWDAEHAPKSPVRDVVTTRK